MQITATTFIPPQAGTPAAPAAGAPAGETSPFAKLLSGHEPAKKDAPADTQAEPRDAAPAEDDGAAQRPADMRRTGGRGTARATGPRDAARTGKSEPARALDADPKADASSQVRVEAATEDKPETPSSKTGADTPPAEWLAAMAKPAAPGVPLPAGPSAAPAPGKADEAALLTPGRPAATPVSRDEVARGAADAAIASALDAGAAQVAAKSVAFSEHMAAAVETCPAAEPRTELSRLADLTALPAAGLAHRADAAPSAPLAVNLPTPVTQPEFREALGVQVSLLAREGVQRAELHLNPADMGPISVQIALDGTRAQVDFGADSFATRQVIESGLPELAAALRDAGFTLTGGGVSQHPRGQSQQEPPASSPPGTTARGEAAGEPARRVTVRMPQGALDLYA
ncbi:MAG TPA: flagellar hook-length control protein FliK [Albitalea sp.]|uniref:flagellar hook-length control protein FliK n=1 Tax=Piscinibacter sp. TaxID=1903157 RepID=UPI002ED4047B